MHSEGLKAEYEAASAGEKSKWGFDYDYLRDMQKYIDECNRRIDSAQRRLEKTPDEIRQTNNLVRGSLYTYHTNAEYSTDIYLFLVETNIRHHQNDQHRPPRDLDLG